MIGILIVTHAPLGQALLATLEHVYKRSPEAVRAVDVLADEDVTAVAERLNTAITAIDRGDGVLVFTDMCGATPANCAVRLVQSRAQTELIYGVSLPALLRAVCYRQLPLSEVAAKAVEGGQRGLFVYERGQAATCPNN